MDPSNPESPPASPPGESMRPAAVQLDDGVYFFLPMDGAGEWSEVRVREGKLFRLVPIDEGVALLEVLGSFAGPLRMPQLTVAKVH